MKIRLFALVLIAFIAKSASASADVTGTVAMLEVWRSGNVAFTLTVSSGTPACNGQFILNFNDADTKNRYAAILAAKKTGSQVRVVSEGCGEAYGYGSSYNLVLYLYVLD